MYRFDGNTIYLTRGDTLRASLSIKQNDSDYTPQAGDSIRFALKRSDMKHDRSGFIDSKPLILKDIPIDTMVLRLDSKDTKDLKFGVYVYDIQITMGDGTVDTFITDKIYITPEVD